MAEIYALQSLTGGSYALDDIDGALLFDLDAAIVTTLTAVYHYSLDDDSGAAHSSPDVIAPTLNPGTKRWILVSYAIIVASSIHGVAAKATPIDADEVAIIDTAASNALKKSTWTQIKAFLKTYFDTLYNDYSLETHASDHTDGTDDIQSATNAVKGVATAAQITTLEKAILNDTADEFTKTLNFNQTALTDAATVAWDLESNQVCSVTITANRTMGAPTNNVIGATYILTVIQDGTGGWTLAWNAEFLWEGDEAPVVAAGIGEKTIIMFKDDGTNLFGKVFWTES